MSTTTQPLSCYICCNGNSLSGFLRSLVPTLSQNKTTNSLLKEALRCKPQQPRPRGFSTPVRRHYTVVRAKKKKTRTNGGLNYWKAAARVGSIYKGLFLLVPYTVGADIASTIALQWNVCQLSDRLRCWQICAREEADAVVEAVGRGCKKATILSVCVCVCTKYMEVPNGFPTPMMIPQKTRSSNSRVSGEISFRVAYDKSSEREVGKKVVGCCCCFCYRALGIYIYTHIYMLELLVCVRTIVRLSSSASSLSNSRLYLWW